MISNSNEVRKTDACRRPEGPAPRGLVGVDPCCSRMYRAATTGMFVACLCASTGCGFVSSGIFPGSAGSSTNPSGQAPNQVVTDVVQVAAERPYSNKPKTPQLVTLQTARMLPKPGLDVTPEVQRELDRYLTRERGTVMEVLARRGPHNDMLKRVFEGEGVPLELLSVAAIESKYNPNAKSPAGARGMWQFMGSTAKLYGLKVGGLVDERLDPVRSTVAAARHLRDLFLSYNDWHLALAAYNAGIGRINKLVTRNGSNDFWELARAGELSGETARFVPKVIALTIIVKDPDLYGFESTKIVS